VLSTFKNGENVIIKYFILSGKCGNEMVNSVSTHQPITLTATSPFKHVRDLYSGLPSI